MPEQSSKPVLSMRGFSLGLHAGGQQHYVLRDCDLELAAGGFYLLLGRSGAGKSTLLKWLCGLWDVRDARPLTKGSCHLLGQELGVPFPAELRPKVSAVLQDEGLLDDLSVRENVELALEAAGRSPKLAVALLSQAGLEHPPERVSALSGGMRKRAGVARGLAAEPRLFVFDEPTAGLDEEAALQIATLLRTTHEESRGRRTTIVITHDLAAFAGIPAAVIEIDASNKSLLLRDPDEAMQEAGPHAPRSLAPPEDPLLQGIRRLVLETGGAATTLVQALGHLWPSWPRLCLRSMGRCLLESAFFVTLGSALIGGLATYFALRNSPLEGAFPDQIITGVGKVLVAVLVPLMAGFFFTARMAAGAAARLGTMQLSNQVAALRLMGINVLDYLLTPLVWGFGVAMPLITLGAVLAAALSSAAVAQAIGDFTDVRWHEAFFASLSLDDLRHLLLKTLLSAFLVAVATFHLAIAPKRSGQDVGNSVNLAIVVGMVIVLLVHGAFTVWQFA